jgi:hypothetical protein
MGAHDVLGRFPLVAKFTHDLASFFMFSLYAGRSAASKLCWHAKQRSCRHVSHDFDA